MKKNGIFDPLTDPNHGHILTRAIIDTIHEPLIVLDEDLRVIVASHSFYKKFSMVYENTHGQLFSHIANKRWNISELIMNLKKVIGEGIALKGYEITYELPFLGTRTVLVSAREIQYKSGGRKILVSLFDISEQRLLEIEKEKLLAQKDLLLKEMRHRIANSLQLIASILILKAGMVKSEETRFQLEDAHSRIMTVATVQEQLDSTALDGGEIKVEGYLTALCKSLAKSMIGGRKPITLEVVAGAGVVTAEEAISFGLITTELVINSLKHAFPDGRSGAVVVTYSKRGLKWKLSISDNGIGKSKKQESHQPGLGTGIVSALAAQMKAKIVTKSTSRGTTVSVVKK